MAACLPLQSDEAHAMTLKNKQRRNSTDGTKHRDGDNKLLTPDQKSATDTGITSSFSLHTFASHGQSISPEARQACVKTA